MVVMVSPAQKREIVDRAQAMSLGTGEYLRSVLFPDTTQAELNTLQHQVNDMERRINQLEASVGQRKE